MADTVKRHPIRGFLYGIVFGLGLALVAIGQKWAALGTWPPFILFVVGIVVGTLWSTFGPAKGPKGEAPPPAAAEPEPIDEPSADPAPAEDPPQEDLTTTTADHPGPDTTVDDHHEMD